MPIMRSYSLVVPPFYIYPSFLAINRRTDSFCTNFFVFNLRRAMRNVYFTKKRKVHPDTLQRNHSKYIFTGTVNGLDVNDYLWELTRDLSRLNVAVIYIIAIFPGIKITNVHSDGAI